MYQRYFYHSDHLGSSSWITDAGGDGYQHFQYLPFGENWVEQRLGTYNSPYQFSGKEKDEETGYNYFGARYYDPELSIWLSVDPLSDIYASVSHFNYCGNSPIVKIDLQGLAEFSVTSYRNSHGDIYKTDINILSSSGGGDNHLIHLTQATTDDHGNVIMQPSVSYLIKLVDGALVYDDNETGNSTPQEVLEFIEAFSTEITNNSGESISYGIEVFTASGDQKDIVNPQIVKTVTDSKGNSTKSSQKHLSRLHPQNNPPVSDQQPDFANNIPGDPKLRIDPNTGAPVNGTGGADGRIPPLNRLFQGVYTRSVRINRATGQSTTRLPNSDSP